MKKLVLAFALVLGINSAQAGTVVDQLVWEASPVQQDRLNSGIANKKGYFVQPYWYTYDTRTKLCYAKYQHGMSVVLCTDLVIEQIIKDYTK